MKILTAWYARVVNCANCMAMNDPSWTHCCKCKQPLEDWEVKNYPGGK